MPGADGHAAASDHHSHGHIGRDTYYRVFAALMVLMVLTVGAWWVEGFMEIPRVLGVLVALAIASTKTVLIIYYFMHIKISNRVTQLYAVSAFIAFTILFVIVMGDYFARGWPPEIGPLP
ncbi:cytochrome C oxidase subunit IV family protein [Candidatus Chloroploca sp. M-50]|uniref:Cytochrome C oxidase subunit IV family protein n=2 Tax=Candidatus Chloroploca mongolica TaxID=2528176 RepID=A0ABS4DER4_9CHLR|nr:cytochrome C oxidase subunit IV family protein [Candidatus Chloroploca mongolica]